MADKTSKYDDIMSKSDAEQVLLIDEEYTKEMLDQKYHEAVARSVIEQDDEMLAELDKAHATLSTLFISGESTVSASGASTDKGGTSIFDVIDGIEKIEQKQKEHDKWFGGISMKTWYTRAHHKACRTMNVPEDTDYPAPKRSGEPPMWFRAVLGLLGAPIWRVAFIVLLVWYGVASMQLDYMGDVINAVLAWIIIIVLVAVNTITGFFTNLLRRGINAVAEWILEKQLEHQELSALKQYLTSADSGAE